MSTTHSRSPAAGKASVHDDENQDVEATSSEDAAPDPGPDPIAELKRHMSDALASLQRHWSIMLDDLRDKAVKTLYAACLVLCILVCVLTLCVLGCFYLASGVVAGLESLTGSLWIARLLAGTLLLVVPLVCAQVAIGRATRSRNKATSEKYQDLFDQERTP